MKGQYQNPSIAKDNFDRVHGHLVKGKFLLFVHFHNSE